MASQRASITKESLRESLESVWKPFKIHSLDDGKFSCVLEFLLCSCVARHCVENACHNRRVRVACLILFSKRNGS